jgi:acetylornithine deacetylase/succinyl-diaminopimelate desuccinylase-like protein
VNHSLRSLPFCQAIFDYIDHHFDDYLQTLIQICEVPAPTYLERRRAEFFAGLFRDAGFHPTIDEVGNVHAPVYQKPGKHLVLSAHLDTVFAFETIQVKRTNSILYAPGISDDSAGLAALLLLARAMKASDLPVEGSLTIVATVGEEGLGNLRGARNLFSIAAPPIDCFISFDGTDPERIVTSGLASKRVRIRIHGPGGHSWGDADAPNPIHIAGELLHRINRFSLPRKPKTTINTGIIKGGTSINAIPSEVALDLDLRSEAEAALRSLSEALTAALWESVDHQESITGEMEVLGERPAGSIASDHRLVQIARAANEHFGFSSSLESGSTDSNIPFAAGIPALTIGVGGKSGKIHTPEEWYDYTGAERGLKRTALLIAELLQP